VGEPVAGPAILYQRDTTISVPPGWTATAEASGPIVLTNQEVARLALRARMLRRELA
jgi:hypothetical protein